MNWQSSVFHESIAPYLEGDYGTFGSSLKLRLRAAREAPIQKVFLSTTPEGEQVMVQAHPIPDLDTHDCRWWEAVVKMDAPRLPYSFMLDTTEGNFWLTGSGLSRFVPQDSRDFQLVQAAVPVVWVKRGVFYQIFPERFADGDPSNNVRPGETMVEGKPSIVKKWGQAPDWATGGREFYGGDIEGIIQHLDHLHETLGISALYLNPIFTAPSAHKYDVANYNQVDPHFGGDAALARLHKALQERHMYLMLDIVPNHCGSQNVWFKEAQASAEAPTADFFTFYKRPDDYLCWFGYKYLPKLNYASQKLRNAMYAGPNSVFRKWLRPPYSINGWRLDVSNMMANQGRQQLNHEVLRGMRVAIKEENPQAYYLGETFFDGSAALQGDQLDAAMNYRGFMSPLYDWLLVPETGAFAMAGPDLAAQWATYRSAIPFQLAQQQFNLLGSHDTPRLLTMVKGDHGKALAAMVCLFGYLGVPSIYYGDEVGMRGGKDPDNRRCMLWNEHEWDLDWMKIWQSLVRLRSTSPALSYGAIQQLVAERDTLAFLRESPEQRVLVVAHRGQNQVLEVPVWAGAVPERSRWHELLTGQRASVEGGILRVVSNPGQIWMEAR